jgi:hypothetical protein
MVKPCRRTHVYLCFIHACTSHSCMHYIELLQNQLPLRRGMPHPRPKHEQRHRSQTHNGDKDSSHGSKCVHVPSPLHPWHDCVEEAKRHCEVSIRLTGHPYMCDIPMFLSPLTSSSASLLTGNAQSLTYAIVTVGVCPQCVSVLCFCNVDRFNSQQSEPPRSAHTQRTGTPKTWCSAPRNRTAHIPPR